MSFIIASTCLLSCGKSSDSKSSSKPWAEPVLVDEAEFLTMKGADCNSYSVFSDDISIELYRFIDGYYTQNYYSFTNQIEGRYVLSSNQSPISSTKYNEKYEQIIYAKYNASSDQYEASSQAYKGIGKVVSKGSNFELCPSYSTYSRYDLESVALNASDIITRTYDAVTSVTSTKLPPIKLSIQPEQKIYIRFVGGPANKQQRLVYQADNASYNSETKEITMLPHSRDFSGAKFWEMPFVPSHEYGHHIFREFTKGLESDFSEYTGCFHPEIKHIRNMTDGYFQEFSYRSMNEGFADLMAFYTLDAPESSLDDVRCFEKNRDVSSSTFKSGDRKVFTSIGQYYMDSTTAHGLDLDCNDLDYQQIHHIGAVFAYNANQILAKYFTENKERLRAMITFAKKLKSRKEDFKELDPSEILYFALVDLYAIAIEQSGQDLNTFNCSMLAPVFDHSLPDSGCRKFL